MGNAPPNVLIASVETRVRWPVCTWRELTPGYVILAPACSLARRAHNALSFVFVECPGAEHAGGPGALGPLIVGVGAVPRWATSAGPPGRQLYGMRGGWHVDLSGRCVRRPRWQRAMSDFCGARV